MRSSSSIVFVAFKRRTLLWIKSSCLLCKVLPLFQTKGAYYSKDEWIRDVYRHFEVKGSLNSEQLRSIKPNNDKDLFRIVEKWALKSNFESNCLSILAKMDFY